MSDINPILLLMFGLLVVGNTILWALSIYVAAKLSRRAARRRWPWVLLACSSRLPARGLLRNQEHRPAAEHRREATRRRKECRRRALQAGWLHLP